jgi:hypothetical protein
MIIKTVVSQKSTRFKRRAFRADGNSVQRLLMVLVYMVRHGARRMV